MPDDCLFIPPAIPDLENKSRESGQARPPHQQAIIMMFHVIIIVFHQLSEN